MRLLLGSWVLASFAFALGWGIRSAMIGNRRPRKVRRARSRVMTVGQIGLFTTLAGKLMVGGVALAAVGGLAVEGSLPRPVQKAVSAAAERVGLQIPSGGDEDEPRLAASSESEGPPVIRRRVLEVIDNWEGEKDCEYLRALVQAAGASPPTRCPGEDGDGAKSASNQGSLGPGVVIPEPTTGEPTPPTSGSPSAEPSPSEPPLTEPPTEPPPAEPPSSEPPSAEPPSGEPPVGEPPLAEPPTGEAPLAEPPLTEPPAESTPIEPAP